MKSFRQNSTVVLVHGAWADGSCWDNVILPLQTQGLKVICAPIPLTSLSDDAAALSRALERTSGPVVLAGHAYGGAVIVATGEDRVNALVYTAALAPDGGETVAKVFYRDESHPNASKLSPDKHGFIWMPEDGFHQAVAHKASTDQKRVMAAIQRPIAVQCIQEPTPKPAWRAKPSWYLLAEGDRMINPKTQRFRADRMGAKVHSRRVDHTPMYSEPNVVIDVIVEAARNTLVIASVADIKTDLCLRSEHMTNTKFAAMVIGASQGIGGEPQHSGWRAISQPWCWLQETKTNWKQPQPIAIPRVCTAFVRNIERPRRSMSNTTAADKEASKRTECPTLHLWVEGGPLDAFYAEDGARLASGGNGHRT